MASASPASLADRLFARLLWILPTRAISRALHNLAQSRRPFVKRTFIRLFLRAYPAVDLSEAKYPDPEAYATFNDFFTRALGPGKRKLPVDDQANAVSPIDGRLGAFGVAERGILYQTKGVAYDLGTLLGDDGLVSAFTNGHYATLYLAPHDYHRVHMPITARVRETRYVPGRLFGVNPRCVRAVPRLFSRNERLVTVFDSDAGPMAMVMVGAFIVGGIHTRANGQVCPPHRRASRAQKFLKMPAADYTYQRGEEMGYFSFGSSVILLFGPGVVDWSSDMSTGQTLRVGHIMGGLANPPVLDSD